MQAPIGEIIIDQFELEDLLRASAEMLGKGSLGTVYKAVLDDGCTVAVKRLKDANPCVRKEFEQYMDVIGKLKHPNIVRFRAYYYAKEEKLLVYDYLPNGSLHCLLHGWYLLYLQPYNHSWLLFFLSLTLDLDLDLVNAIRKPRTRKNSLGLDYQDQLGVRGCSRPCSSSRRVCRIQNTSWECQIFQYTA